MATSSTNRYARCVFEDSKKPPFSNSKRHFAKSASISKSGSADRGEAHGRLGNSLSVFHAFAERMWNSLNASVASAPVLASM